MTSEVNFGISNLKSMLYMTEMWMRPAIEKIKLIEKIHNDCELSQLTLADFYSRKLDTFLSFYQKNFRG